MRIITYLFQGSLEKPFYTVMTQSIDAGKTYDTVVFKTNPLESNFPQVIKNHYESQSVTDAKFNHMKTVEEFRNHE